MVFPRGFAGIEAVFGLEVLMFPIGVLALEGEVTSAFFDRSKS